RLRSRRCAIDLVREEHVGEHRARAVLEFLRLLIEDRESGDVGRKQVRGELDSLERTIECAGGRAGEHGLAKPWNVLEEDVALSQEGDQNEVDHLALSDDHLTDTTSNSVGNPGDMLDFLKRRRG